MLRRIEERLTKLVNLDIISNRDAHKRANVVCILSDALKPTANDETRVKALKISNEYFLAHCFECTKIGEK